MSGGVKSFFLMAGAKRNVLCCLPALSTFERAFRRFQNKISVVSTFFAILLVWISKPKTFQPSKAY
jgi:hypothetical protein